MAKLKKQLLKELNKLRIQKSALVVICLSLGVFAVAGVALAANGFSWANVEASVSEMLFEQASEPEEGSLGASTSPLQMGNEICSNGYCEYTVAVDFIDASTTIASVPNPFRAVTTTANQVVLEDVGRFGLMGPTSTVGLVSLNITGASTSTAEDISCGASATPYAAATYKILDSDIVVTSSKGVIENGIATAVNAGIGGGTIQKIMVTPELPYVVCTVTAAMDGGFVGNNNTFAGKATVQFRKQR